MRRVDGAARQDHLACYPDPALLPRLAKGDADAALVFAEQAGGEGIGLDAQIGPAFRLSQKRARSRAAEATVTRHLRIADPLLLAAVEVLGEGDSHLLRCIDEAMRQGQSGTIVFEQDRPALAAFAAGARRVALDRFEIRQDLIKGPALAAHLGPAIVVCRIAPDPEHAVDRAGAAEHAPLFFNDTATT